MQSAVESLLWVVASAAGRAKQSTGEHGTCGWIASGRYAALAMTRTRFK
jgi:hypothetical protein